MLGPLRARFSNLTSGTFSKKGQPSDPRIYGNSQGILGGLPKYKDQVKFFFVAKLPYALFPFGGPKLCVNKNLYSERDRFFVLGYWGS